MAYIPPNSNGQALAANSAPVALATEDVQDLMIVSNAMALTGFNLMISASTANAFDTISGAPTGPVSYRSFFTQINATSAGGSTAGAIIFEGSNDNVNFAQVTYYDNTIITPAPVLGNTFISLSTSRFFSGKVIYRYMRCRIAIAPLSATLQGFTRFSAIAYEDGGNSEYTRTILTQGSGRNIPTTATSTNSALTVGIKAISIYSRGSDAYFQIGNGVQTASSSTCYIGPGERLDYDVTPYATPNIAAVFGPAAAATTIYITEMS